MNTKKNSKQSSGPTEESGGRPVRKISEKKDYFKYEMKD